MRLSLRLICRRVCVLPRFAAAAGAVACAAFVCAGALAEKPPGGKSGEHWPQTMTIADVRSPSSTQPWALPVSVIRNMEMTGVPVRQLPALNVEPLLAEDAHAGHAAGTGYSVNRTLHINLSDGRWYPIGDGAIWAVDVFVPQALGLRVHFSAMNLPSGAFVMVYPPNEPTLAAGPYSRRGPNGTGRAWTPTRFKDRLRVELFAPEKDALAAARGSSLVIDRIHQVYRDLSSADLSLTCEQTDVACYPQWSQTARAVAAIGVIDSKGHFFSGQLINTLTDDYTPYFLVANHCIATAQQAESMEVYWLYQLPECSGSDPPPISSVPQSGVCTLVAAGEETDFSLLMIEGSLPAGLSWAGWTTEPIVGFANVVGIHHPDAGHKRINFGATSLTASTCSPGAANINTDWFSGSTMNGSSGSGLFLDSTQQLIGHDRCSNGGCAPAAHTTYGRFSETYPSIAAMLVAGADDALEPNSQCADAVPIVVGEVEDLLVKSVDEDWYRVHVPGGATLALALEAVQIFGRVQVSIYSGCGASAIASTPAMNDAESLSFTNPGSDADFLVRVHLVDDVRNTYSLEANVIVHPSPVNDDCANAELITLAQESFTTLGATTDGPDEPLACAASADSLLLRDVWFRYVAPCSGVAEVSSCGSAFATKLAVYAAGCPALKDVAIVCSDDGEACATQAEVRFGVTGGAEYLIRIGGQSGASGNGMLNVNCDACPADVSDAGLGAGLVDIDDLLMVINSWNAIGGAADVVPDRIVNIDDLLAVIASWGPCGK